jgi:hypothetical protein
VNRHLLAFALGCAALAGATAASAQILNTLSGFGDRPGWQGQGTALAELSGGNTESQDYGFDLAGQWKGESERFRLIAGYDFSSENDVTSKEESRVHLRHNHQIDRRISTLAFVQYQRNPFQDLQRRMLWGAGLRFEIHDRAPNRLGIGVSAMYEVDRLTTGDRAGVMRLSTFLDFWREIHESLRSAIVGWYQPRFDDFSDTRVSVIANLEVDLHGPFKLIFEASLDYDSKPPADVDELDWDVASGLRFSL